MLFTGKPVQEPSPKSETGKEGAIVLRGIPGTMSALSEGTAHVRTWGKTDTTGGAGSTQGPSGQTRQHSSHLQVGRRHFQGIDCTGTVKQTHSKAIR